MSLDRLIQSNAELQYPSVKPELDLNFTRKTLKGIDPAYSFTRNSAATYVDADGYIKTAGINQPRFEYDLDTGEYKGLLIEESRTNLAPNSIAALSNTTLSNVIAPDGTLTARDWDGSINTGSIHGSFPNTDTIYTVSFFVRQIDNTSTAFRARSWGGAPSTRLDLIYNLATDTISFFSNSNSAGGTGTTMTPTLKVEFFNDGWRRISMTGYIRNESGFYFNETGTTKTTYQLWGFQVEQGSFPTSYIPTSGSTVTRQPDQLVLNKTLNTQGTFFIESNPTRGVSLAADNGSSSLLISQPINQYTKSVLYYNTNRTLRMASDDSVPSDYIYTNPQDLNRISLGFNRLSNDNYINGYLKKFSYYSSPLSEDNLRALTGNKVSIFRTSGSANIVTDGLVLNLDAGNPASYPGSGTTWTDLSGNGRNATVNGSPTFTNGYFDITSDSTYISLSNSGLVPRTNDFTYSTWINFDATDSLDTIFENGYWTDTLLFRYQTNSVAVYAEGALRGTFSWTASAGVWYNVIFKRDGGTCSMYINNTLTGTPFTMTTDINLANTNLFLMRSQYASNQFLNGKISTFSIYNRALTAAEVQQNFNVLRGRFGI